MPMNEKGPVSGALSLEVSTRQTSAGVMSGCGTMRM